MRILWLLVLILSAPCQAQGSVLLVGGGEFPPDAMAWFVAHAPDRQVLLLDYEDNESARTRAALEAAGATVLYLPVASPEAADDPVVLARIKTARAVFLPGGDQWKYVSRWRGRAVLGAIRSVVARGGVVGGTSAGAMVLGSVVYDARDGGDSTQEVLAEPAGPGAALTVGFLDLLPGVIVDTHVAERARLGRLAAFVARHHAERGVWATGLGVDDGTALAIGPDGTGTVFGSGIVALLTVPDSSATARVAVEAPLSGGPFRLAQVAAGGRIDLAQGTVAPVSAASFEPAALRPVVVRLHLVGSRALGTGTRGGPLDAFLAEAGNGPICLLTSEGAARGATLGEMLSARARKIFRFDLSPARRPSATEMAGCAAFAVAGLDLSVAASWLDVSAALGAAVRDRLSEGAPILFVGADAALAGRTVLLGTSDTQRAAAEGRLSLVPGLDLAGGLVIVPESDAESGAPLENRAAGLAWALVTSLSSAGVLLSETSAARLDDLGLHVGTGGEPAVPALVLDVRGTPWASVPAVRQNGAFVGALLALAPGATWPPVPVETVQDEPVLEIPEVDELLPPVEPQPVTPRRRPGW